MERLDTTNLAKAINSLEGAIFAFNQKQEAKEEPVIIETLRAGVIQNFEFTYELSWKLISKWIVLHHDRSLVDGVPRKEIFRVAGRLKLIEDVHAWFEFHESRNRTSHEYGEIIAVDVYHSAVEFLPVAKNLLDRLNK